MTFLEFNSTGELVRYGTFNGNETKIFPTNIFVYVDDTNLDLSKIYYDSISKEIKQYTEEQYTHKQKYSVFDGEWSNITMSRNLFDNIENQWIVIRDMRNRLLQQSDWTQLPDVPLATKEAWADYRQQLRDITNQPDPFNIVWPEPPK